MLSKTWLTWVLLSFILFSKPILCNDGLDAISSDSERWTIHDAIERARAENPLDLSKREGNLPIADEPPSHSGIGQVKDSTAIESREKPHGHRHSNDNLAADFMLDLLEEVRQNADNLESGLRKSMLPDEDNRHRIAVLETVVKVIEGVEEEGGEVDPGKKKMIFMIDQENNQYVLTRPFDTTVIYEDDWFLYDIVFIFVVSFIFGWIFSMLGLPAFFGYIITGCVLGPAGFNIIKELIQTETLGQLGVIFILFVLGLEFSIEKIRSMWRIAFGGALLILCLSVACFLTGGILLNSSLTEAVFVGACISLSSTAVVVKCFRSDDMEPLYGLLVMQDVLLGVMLAVMPALTKSGIEIFLAIAKMGLSFAAFGGISYLLHRLFLAARLSTRFHSHQRHSSQGNNKELVLLGAVALCLVMLIFSKLLGLGMELGCFMAGVILRACKTHLDSAMAAIEPVRDIFSCIFFVSIGLHVYPSFLLHEGLLLLTLAAAAIGFKYVIIFSVLALFRFDLRQSSSMAISLAQISEFSFVLASRAKQLGIITREVYYLLIAVTALSLVGTPLVWNIVNKPEPKITSPELPPPVNNGNAPKKEPVMSRASVSSVTSRKSMGEDRFPYLLAQNRRSVSIHANLNSLGITESEKSV
ncbi:uncharacterized protein VTP21DRAFT_11543 [Calcarisporiella thermophila]|uniref:uncharacterized protein n=1 Tax=Calcarisporiella thermophila TaxID=911321 RepID=UPI00374355D8